MTTVYVSHSIKFALGLSVSERDTVCPIFREALEVNFHQCNRISDHSRCDSCNQICPGAGHLAKKFPGGGDLTRF